MNVSAIIVTRGDVDLEPIFDSLPVTEWEVIVWDNSAGVVRHQPPGWTFKAREDDGSITEYVMPQGSQTWYGGELDLDAGVIEQRFTDLAVYGRYAAIEYATSGVIYVQDDDCVLPFESLRELVAAYEPGRLIANMPRSRWEGYPDSTLVGWGALFDRDLPRAAFGRLPQLFIGREDREWFHLTCDVAFSALTPRTIIDVPFSHLPWAEGPGRMFTSRPTHNDERQRMLELCRSIRSEDDDRRDW